MRRRWIVHGRSNDNVLVGVNDMKPGPCSEEAVFLKWCWLGDDRVVNDVLEGTPNLAVIHKIGVGRALCCDSMASPEGFGHCRDRQTSIGGGGGILNSVLDRLVYAAGDPYLTTSDPKRSPNKSLEKHLGVEPTQLGLTQ